MQEDPIWIYVVATKERVSFFFSPLIFFSTLKQRRGWDSGKWHQITWQVSSCETYHFDSVMHTKNLKCLCRPSSEIFREERTGKKGEIGSYIRQVELEVLQLGTTTTLKPRNIFRLFCNDGLNHVWCSMSVCSKLKIGRSSWITKSWILLGLSVWYSNLFNAQFNNIMIGHTMFNIGHPFVQSQKYGVQVRSQKDEHVQVRLILEVLWFYLYKEVILYLWTIGFCHNKTCYQTCRHEAWWFLSSDGFRIPPPLTPT